MINASLFSLKKCRRRSRSNSGSFYQLTLPQSCASLGIFGIWKTPTTAVLGCVTLFGKAEKQRSWWRSWVPSFELNWLPLLPILIQISLNSCPGAQAEVFLNFLDICITDHLWNKNQGATSQVACLSVLVWREGKFFDSPLRSSLHTLKIAEAKRPQCLRKQLHQHFPRQEKVNLKI